MPIFTIGHGTRPSKELVACLREVQGETLVDVIAELLVARGHPVVHLLRPAGQGVPPAVGRG